MFWPSIEISQQIARDVPIQQPPGDGAMNNQDVSVRFRTGKLILTSGVQQQNNVVVPQPLERIAINSTNVKGPLPFCPTYLI